MKFMDTIEICVKAGKGGDGIVSFKSAKGKPRLGPDGGDGGTGGSVLFQGDPGLNTLSSLRFRAIYKAEDGVKGGPNCCRGRCGEDLIIPVPVGTVVRCSQTGDVIGELITPYETLVVAKGGRHGLGNTHWATSTHQAPEEFRPGALGEERNLTLDLKLIADVGLAGFPNAGKSTLLGKLSAAKPKIADYPFTTLTPQLGVVDVGNGGFSRESFVLADIPGLIEGASDGKGLGLEFLKHLERTAVIAYILDLDHIVLTPLEAFHVLKSELMKYSEELAKKPFVIVLNKVDCADLDYVSLIKGEFENYFGHMNPLTSSNSVPTILAVSGLTGEGLGGLKRCLFALMTETRQKKQEAPSCISDLEPMALSESFLPWET